MKARREMRFDSYGLGGYREPSLATELSNAKTLLEAAQVILRIDIAELPLPRHIDAVLGWATREGVTNIVRHSRAHHCTISLSRQQESARLLVCNDGCEGANKRFVMGHGLRGLQERVSSYDGTLRAEADEDGNFNLHVSLPLHEDPEHDSNSSR